MKTHHNTATHTASTTAHTDRLLRIPPRYVILAFFVLALALRLYNSGDFWTADEAKHWSVRVGAFLPALAEGNYAATNMVGHPGVTTMWLGSLGVLLYNGIAALGWLAPNDPALYRYFLRVPIAIVTSLIIATAYPMLRRLTNGWLALLTVFLWITDPFLAAHSKLLHVDALLTDFILMALLAALVAMRFDVVCSTHHDQHTHNGISLPTHHLPIRWGYLALSAMCGGFALLTKSPSLILVPMVSLITLLGIARHTNDDITLPRTPSRYVMLLWHTTRILFVWSGIAAVVWVATWPAAWVDPIGSASTVLNEIVRNGAEPHGWGNYFFGKPVNDPGLLFYPVAIAFRLTPWSLIGCIVALVATVKHYRAQRAAGITYNPIAFAWRTAPAITLLVLYAIIFTAIMSLLAKKFDRYVLPIFPVLDMVAAYGLIWLITSIEARFFSIKPEPTHLVTTNTPPPITTLRHHTRRIVWLIITHVMSITLVAYHPYELTYYNTLLGGGKVAQHILFTGWGEGLEQAGAYIREQYNGCELGVASWYELVIQPYTCSPVLHQGYITVPGHVHYAVLYRNQVQRAIRMDTIQPYLDAYGSLVHTVTFRDVAYAYVYQLRQPREHTIHTAFGATIAITGYDINTNDIRSSGILTFTTQWHVTAPMTDDYMLFVHVFDDKGTMVGQLDVPPGGTLATSTWHPNHFIDWVHRVPVRADVVSNSDTLWLTIGIYNPHTFARLPVRPLLPLKPLPKNTSQDIAAIPATPATPIINNTIHDGTDALLLAPIPIE